MPGWKICETSIAGIHLAKLIIRNHLHMGRKYCRLRFCLILTSRISLISVFIHSSVPKVLTSKVKIVDNTMGNTGLFNKDLTLLLSSPLLI